MIETTQHTDAFETLMRELPKLPKETLAALLPIFEGIMEEDKRRERSCG